MNTNIVNCVKGCFGGEEETFAQKSIKTRKRENFTPLNPTELSEVKDIPNLSDVSVLLPVSLENVIPAWERDLASIAADESLAPGDIMIEGPAPVDSGSSVTETQKPSEGAYMVPGSDIVIDSTDYDEHGTLEPGAKTSQEDDFDEEAALEARMALRDSIPKIGIARYNADGSLAPGIETRGDTDDNDLDEDEMMEAVSDLLSERGDVTAQQVITALQNQLAENIAVLGGDPTSTYAPETTTPQIVLESYSFK